MPGYAQDILLSAGREACIEESAADGLHTVVAGLLAVQGVELGLEESMALEKRQHNCKLALACLNSGAANRSNEVGTPHAYLQAELLELDLRADQSEQEAPLSAAERKGKLVALEGKMIEKAQREKAEHILQARHIGERAKARLATLEAVSNTVYAIREFEQLATKGTRKDLDDKAKRAEKLNVDTSGIVDTLLAKATGEALTEHEGPGTTRGYNYPLTTPDTAISSHMVHQTKQFNILVFAQPSEIAGEQHTPEESKEAVVTLHHIIKTWLANGAVNMLEWEELDQATGALHGARQSVTLLLGRSLTTKLLVPDPPKNQIRPNNYLFSFFGGFDVLFKLYYLFFDRIDFLTDFISSFSFYSALFLSGKCSILCR
jgi:hypothetical protein